MYLLVPLDSHAYPPRHMPGLQFSIEPPAVNTFGLPARLSLRQLPHAASISLSASAHALSSHYVSSERTMAPREITSCTFSAGSASTRASSSGFPRTAIKSATKPSFT
jgi:hypothetical protein